MEKTSYSEKRIVPISSAKEPAMTKAAALKLKHTQDMIAQKNHELLIIKKKMEESKKREREISMKVSLAVAKRETDLRKKHPNLVTIDVRSVYLPI